VDIAFSSLSSLRLSTLCCYQIQVGVDSDRTLTRNPDLLPAHQGLAVIYSELGREEEARAEAAEVLKISPKYSLEVLRQQSPYKDQAVLERELAALRKAGLK
jgi:hypothetical protein